MLVGPGESQVRGERCGIKVSQAAPGTASRGRLLQKAGSRARELRAVLGPSPEQTARRASVPGWCHQAEAQPGMPASERHPQAPTGTPPLARTPLATGSKSNWAQIALAEGADWSAASRVPRALPGVGRAGGGGAGFKWTHLPQGHSEMIDSGVEPGGQPGLEARRRPGWLGLAACGAALPCFPALPGRMLTPGDTECLPPRCRPSAWPLPSCSAHHRDSGF